MSAPTAVQQRADVRKVQVGQDTPWGVASEFCAGSQIDGRWACATHGIASFADRDAFFAHVDDESDGPHLIGWHCHSGDGQVHGFRRP